MAMSAVHPNKGHYSPLANSGPDPTRRRVSLDLPECMGPAYRSCISNTDGRGMRFTHALSDSQPVRGESGVARLPAFLACNDSRHEGPAREGGGCVRSGFGDKQYGIAMGPPTGDESDNGEVGASLACQRGSFWNLHR